MMSAAREAIDPGHGVFEVLVRIGTERHEFRKIRVTDSLDLHPRSRHPAQLYLGPGDESRQTKASDRGSEPFRVRLRRAQ